jgi:hypothetical protein
MALIAYTGAQGTAVDGLRAARAALAAGLRDLEEDHLVAAPSVEEWSIAEVLDHVAEHDRTYDEYRRLGIDHYVEHGLEHAAQIWRLRAGRPRREG